MAFADIIQSVLNYGFNFNIGGGDFVFGTTVVGLVVLVGGFLAYKKYLEPFLKADKEKK